MGSVFKKIVFLTVLGFATLVLIGPVLSIVIAIVATFFALVVALASVVLRFLHVGLLAGGPTNTRKPGPGAGWKCLRDNTASFYQAFVIAPWRGGWRWCGGAVHRCEDGRWRLLYLGRTVLET